MRWFYFLLFIIFYNEALAEKFTFSEEKIEIVASVDKNECKKIAEKIQQESENTIKPKVSIKKVSNLQLYQERYNQNHTTTISYSVNGLVCNIKYSQVDEHKKNKSVEFSITQVFDELGFDYRFMLADGCGLTGSSEAIASAKTICTIEQSGKCLDGQDGCAASDEDNCKKVEWYSEITCFKRPEVFKNYNLDTQM